MPLLKKISAVCTVEQISAQLSEDLFRNMINQNAEVYIITDEASA
jgi:hypothetical protein